MAAQKKARGLGRGLDALFGDAEVTPSVPEKTTRRTKADITDNKDQAKEQKNRQGSPYHPIIERGKCMYIIAYAFAP